MSKLKDKILFWKKEDIPISSEVDQKVRKKRFGIKIDPMMEKEFYDYLEFEKKISKKTERYNERIKETMELINRTKATDFKTSQDYLQIKLFYFQKKIDYIQSLKSEKRIRKYDEEFEFTVKTAKELSTKFTYMQLIQSADSRGMRGLEVYGYIEINYPLRWRLLIENGVLDKACFFSMQEYVPEYVTVLRNFDIKKYVKSPVEFREEIRFRSFPDRPFKRAVFYAPKNLREFIKWLNNYPIYIEGYKTNVVLGKANLVLLGWALPDYPQFLVSFSPSQNQAIFEGEIESEDLNADTIDLLQKIIFYYRRENKVNEMKVIEAKMERERYEKRWSHLLDKIETEVPDDPIETREEPKIIYSTNPVFYVIMGFMSIIITLMTIFLALG